MSAKSSNELVLYTHPMSRGRTTRWMLEEIGQPYQTELLDDTTFKSPKYLAINPFQLYVFGFGVAAPLT